MENFEQSARLALPAATPLSTDPAPAATPLSTAPAPAATPTAPALTAYVLPAVAIGLVTSLLHVYFLKYATDVLNLAPAILGAIFGICRLWDAVSDPLAGYWSDRTSSRWGRRRPWIIGAALPLGLATVAVWSPPQALHGTALVLWTGISIVIFYSALTALVVPHAAWGAELTTDYHGRSRVFGAREVADKLGLFLALAAISWLEGAAHQRFAAAQLIAAAAAFLILACGLAVACTTRETPTTRRGPTSPTAAIRDVCRNRQACLLLLVLFLDQLGFATVATLLPYASDYVLGTPGQTASYLLAFVAPTIFSIPIWLRLSRRFGKQRVWIAALVVKIIAFALLFQVSATGGPLGIFHSVIALIAIVGIAHGCSSVLPQSIQADVVDIDERATGERKEGVYFAAWGMVVKAAAGISVMLLGVALESAGFRPNIEQSETVVLLIRLLIAAFPCALLACAALVLSTSQLSAET